MNQQIVTVTGPSLAGKTTLLRNLMARDARIQELISTTTRTPRSGEKNGVNYYFVTEEEFRQLPMVEHCRLADCLYGLTVAEMSRVRSAGFLPIIVVDPFGVRQIAEYAKANDLRHFALFVNAPRQLRYERFIDRVINDKAATSERYAARLRNMVEYEESWYGEFSWDSVVYRYDADTREQVERKILGQIFESQRLPAI